MRITVDYGKCTGLGMCEAAAPELFEVQADGSLNVLDDRPGEESREAVEAAIACCPTEAIRLES